MDDQTDTHAEGRPNASEMKDARQYLTIRQVCALYQIGQATVYRNVKTGNFPAPVKICGSNRWHVDQLPKHEAA
ncbi:AlpA family phage regulatory protein [Rhodobacterales bacterium HKCCSP123]|nr:AlpA family phage regulatory protein [Rhodobacterales bacterium HKCCSP123]